MKTLIRTCSLLLPFLTASGLFAQSCPPPATATYTITAKVKAGGSVMDDYDHSGRGKHGHQFVCDKDTIQWKCNGTCTVTSVAFNGPAPCPVTSSAGTFSCTIADKNDFKIYKYTIVVTAKVGGKTLTDDPDVIVDNAGIGTLGQGGSKKK